MRLGRVLAVCAGLGVVCTTLFASGSADTSSDSVKYSRWPKVRLAGFAIGGGYSHFGGYPGFGYPFYGAFGYGAFGFAPFGYEPWLAPPAAFYDADLEELKLKSLDKSASVFLDGGFAGNAGNLKKIWIEPGTYQVRVVDGTRSFEERIYVLRGKTLTLHPELKSAEGSEQK